MKKWMYAKRRHAIYSAMLVSLASVFLTGCVSTRASLKSYTPVAVLTVYGNSQLPWYDATTTASSDYAATQTGDGLLTGALNRLIDNANPETTLAHERIDDAAAQLKAALEQKGIETVSLEKIKDCKSYKHKGSFIFDYVNNTTPADGYETLQSSSAKLNKLIASETGAKSELYVSFKFEKQKVLDGVHEVGVQARVTMAVYGADSEGKTIISKEYAATSSAYTELSNNTWNKEKVCSYIQDTVTDVIAQFMNEFNY